MVINGVSTAINSIELPQATRSDYITRRYQKVLAAWMISTSPREEKERKNFSFFLINGDFGQSQTGEYGVTSVAISDWPDFAMRAVLLDLNPYGRVPKMDTMLGIIDVLSLIKINQFHIFFRVGSTDASYLCYCKRSVNTLNLKSTF